MCESCIQPPKDPVYIHDVKDEEIHLKGEELVSEINLFSFRFNRHEIGLIKKCMEIYLLEELTTQEKFQECHKQLEITLSQIRLDYLTFLKKSLESIE